MGALPAAVVVGRHDPEEDRAAELVTVVARPTVQHVLLG